VRAFEDGDFVFTHPDDFFGPKVGFDVFRFENGGRSPARRVEEP
jgi:hypothetical protein